MKKSLYIALMEKVLSAYTNEHLDRYYETVRSEGLTEHGFPRLTANIGILLSYGKRTDLADRFVPMMDLCCEEIPKRKDAGNEFSIKEIVFALLELEKQGIFPREKLEFWKNKLKEVKVENCYRVYATTPDSKVYNWAAFAMVSEWMRFHIGAADPDMDFIENQAASQWQWMEENGMYRDPGEPMVYDMVTRGLFAMLFHFGYRGKYFQRWDDALKKAGLRTLKMVSVTGEMPYGGRSNQFLHNEAHCAVILENEATRYAKLGEWELASKFKAAAERSLKVLQSYLSQNPISHVKNAFPRETRYGCENYAYFDKYMITAASFLYAAYLLADDSIPSGELDDLTGESFLTSDHFHKLFLRAGEYSAQYDYRADVHYDASGLGRLQKRKAPSPICHSTPGTDKPAYTIDEACAVPFAVVPEFSDGTGWLSGADPAVIHEVLHHEARGESASALVRCRRPDGREAECAFFLSAKGLRITVTGKGPVGLLLPAFAFDGKTESVITGSPGLLAVRYKDWVCRYRTENGAIRDTGKVGCNRNGHYALFRAEGEKTLTVTVDIFPEKQAVHS
ncbi:MAG: hypothetical protein J6331_04535 [Lentisphaeria bacterium]|nr:hypothetical protein [Lentisphaeria bacterium]